MVGVASSLITISATGRRSAYQRFWLLRPGKHGGQLNVLGFGLGPLIGGMAGQLAPSALDDGLCSAAGAGLRGCGGHCFAKAAAIRITGRATPAVCNGRTASPG